jgi:hypothetical protein
MPPLMKLTRIPALALFAGLLSLSSCETKEKQPAPDEPGFQSSPLAALDYADAVLCAEENTEWAESDSALLFIKASRSLAYFLSSPGTKPFLSVGDVKMDNFSLNFKPDSTYLKQGFEFPSGYAFGNTIGWRIDGQPDFPGFTDSNTGFPSMPVLDSSISDIDRTKSFRLATLIKVTGADSILFAIRSDSTEIFAKKDSTGNSYIFPAYELMKFPKGTARIEITAIRHKTIKKQTRTIVMVNQRVAKKKVTIF